MEVAETWLELFLHKEKKENTSYNWYLQKDPTKVWKAEN